MKGCFRHGKIIETGFFFDWHEPVIFPSFIVEKMQRRTWPF